MVSMSGSDSTILAHYQSRVSDGAWHHLQLSVVGNRAGLVLDGVTQSAVLLTPIRTGEVTHKSPSLSPEHQFCLPFSQGLQWVHSTGKIRSL